MKIIICPGIHEPELTESFVTELLSSQISIEKPNSLDVLIFPEQGILTLSGLHISQFLSDRLDNKLEMPVLFIGFSAGVVGAIAAATIWQLQGGNVKALIAIDGWGVPLAGNFPIHRLSHDYFTHWTSVILGSGEDNFYADPSVDHLSMWRSPQQVKGYWVNQLTQFSQPPKYLKASEFLHLLLKRYG